MTINNFGKAIKQMGNCSFQQSRPANFGEGGESDLQSYQIIRFKCLIFNNKKSQDIPSNKEHSKERNKSNETIPEKSRWQNY